MGLLDIFNGMQNGPRGGRSMGGGMSPITMALLGLLAYKAVKGFSGSTAPAVGPMRRRPAADWPICSKAGRAAALPVDWLAWVPAAWAAC